MFHTIFQLARSAFFRYKMLLKFTMWYSIFKIYKENLANDLLSLNKIKIFIFPFIVSASVEVFLRLLQKEYQWSTNSLKEVLKKLNKDDVTSVKLLASCWSDVQAYFPLGIKRMVEKELRQRNMISWERQRHGSMIIGFSKISKHRTPKLLQSSMTLCQSTSTLFILFITRGIFVSHVK